VEGDGAQGKIRRGTWETRRDGAKARRGREAITECGFRPGVGEAHSSGEAGQCPWSEGASQKTS